MGMVEGHMLFCLGLRAVRSMVTVLKWRGSGVVSMGFIKENNLLKRVSPPPPLSLLISLL